jgi:hypothetical protein
MAKVWLSQGTDADFKCSYMLELVMLKAFQGTPSAGRKNYQFVFRSFLRQMSELRDAKTFFTTFYRRTNIPASMDEVPFVLSLSDPTSNTLNRNNIDCLVTAAMSELRRGGG